MITQENATMANNVRPVTAKHITSGTWTARWGAWVVHLRSTSAGWRAVVWRWTAGGLLEERMQLGLCEGFANATDATTWACELLRESGAKVFIVDRQDIRLEDVLPFHPAPEAVK